MFSQFRNVVEGLAPQPRRASQDASQADHLERLGGSRSGSLDSQQPRLESQSMSSSQLADSAILNLRKSLASQRSASPGPSSLPHSQHGAPIKSNLEERLRAKFAIGEASNGTTPCASARSSPPPPPMSGSGNDPISPRLTPLPESPTSSHAPPLTSHAEPISSSSPPPPLSPLQMESMPAVHTRENHLATSKSSEGDIGNGLSRTLSLESVIHAPDIATMTQRLKLAEQRFADVSVSLKRLQSEKIAIDTLIKEAVPLGGMMDLDWFRDYLQNLHLREEMSQDEIKRLNGKLIRQDGRMEELRDTHRLESASQSDQIERLRRQISEADALINASHSSSSHHEEEIAKQKIEVDRLRADSERWKGVAKDEEEKRVKAISLLKSVRQKLVKAEKDKEEAVKEVAMLKESEKEERDRERKEMLRLQNETDAVNEEREKTVMGLKTQFDREMLNLKDRFEKETSALRGQYELEAVAVKSANTKELSAKISQISTLEKSVSSLSNDKNSFFDELQLRQAEVESSQFHLESLQSQNTELQFQLREANDQLALLIEELAEARRLQDGSFRGPTTPAEDLASLYSAAEAKYDVKIADFKRQLAVVEKERNEGEAEWSRKVHEKAREIESLQSVLESSAKTRNRMDEVTVQLRSEVEDMTGKVRLYQEQVSDLQVQAEKVKDIQHTAKMQSVEFGARIAALERLLEDAKTREAQSRANNKTLREELRKVQSSAALLERQRNPGVGYGTSRHDANGPEPRHSISSTSSSPSRPESPAPVSNNDEVNLEYLRNVILQFLEHKEMRPNLVRVLSIILRFTPQETRRLVAKVFPAVSLRTGMSLEGLTQNSFQAGISPSKWLRLCKLFVSGSHGSSCGMEEVEIALINSVLLLCRSYPNDPSLRDYLKVAIQDGMLSLAVFVPTLLQAVRSPELHHPATLDMLVRVALEAHYSSGLLPIGSVVSFSESPIVVLGTVQDALALLRTSHSFPMSGAHQLTSSASELVILLMSCVTDMSFSQVSTAQAMVHFQDAHDMLSTITLSHDVRQVLEQFVLSLGLLIGDDAKAAREAQMMQTIQIQMALGKGDLGPSSDTDLVSCSLLLHHLVSVRAGEFGSGNASNSVAMLVATLRWTSWSPSIFYRQLLLSAFTCLSQCGASNAPLWRAFIIGRLPQLLIMFENAVKSENTTDMDWRSAMQIASTALLKRSDLISQCNNILSLEGVASDMMQDGYDVSPSVFRDLLQQLLVAGLLERSFAVAMDPLIANDNTMRLQLEAQDNGQGLAAYLDSKLTPDSTPDDVRTLLERVWGDPGSHATFVEVVWKRFMNLTAVFDVESLSHLSKTLYLNEEALNIISLHVKISDLIFLALRFLEEYDCETVGDPQTAVMHLGDVVLFALSTLSRFYLTLGEKTLQSDLINCNAVIRSVDDLAGGDASAFSSWFKALFDSSSEGIEDAILRSTKPKMLLRIAPILFSRAISLCTDKKMDADVLHNGISYFLGPLLHWTLDGVIRTLLREIQLKGFDAPIHLDVLQTLILSPSCPQPVLCLCSQSILRLLMEGKARGFDTNVKFDTNSVQQRAIQSLRLNDGANGPVSLAMSSGVPWQDQPRQAIRIALAMARAGKAPSLDVNRCLLVKPPCKFLQLFWSEASIAAGMGESESCRRLAIFILTTPRLSISTPLLPVFMQTVLPLLITNIDHQQPPEQTMNIELLVTTISSVLTAAVHLEWAFRSASNDQQYILGQPSTAMVRKLACDLRRRKHSPTSGSIAQQLGSLPSFAANFPGFMGEYNH